MFALPLSMSVLFLIFGILLMCGVTNHPGVAAPQSHTVKKIVIWIRLSLGAFFCSV